MIGFVKPLKDRLTCPTHGPMNSGDPDGAQYNVVELNGPEGFLNCNLCGHEFGLQQAVVVEEDGERTLVPKVDLLFPSPGASA